MITSNVERIMKEKGVNILELAMETGLATRTLMRSRGGMVIKCRLETLAKIARCLGVTTKELYDEIQDDADSQFPSTCSNSRLPIHQYAPQE